MTEENHIPEPCCCCGLPVDDALGYDGDKGFYCSFCAIAHDDKRQGGE